MKFATNTRQIFGVYYSTWAFYSLAFLTVAPTVIFYGFGIDTNPVVWGRLQLLVVALGIFGLNVVQTHEGRWVRRAVVAGIVLVTLFFSVPALAMGERTAAPPTSAASSGSQEPSWTQTSRVLTPLVAKWEGKRNTAYFDLVGVPTICYGHTRTITAQDVRAGVTWTDAKCTELLKDELQEYWQGTRAGFNQQTVQSRLTPERDSAFSSLAYNVGIAGVRGSTATRRLNNANIPGACEALAWWNKAGGRVVRGLVNRRTEERALCEQGL